MSDYAFILRSGFVRGAGVYLHVVYFDNDWRVTSYKGTTRQRGAARFFESEGPELRRHAREGGYRVVRLRSRAGSGRR